MEVDLLTDEQLLAALPAGELELPPDRAADEEPDLRTESIVAAAQERPSKRTKLANKPKKRKDIIFGFKLWALGELKKGMAQKESIASIAKRLGVHDRKLRPSGWPAQEVAIRAAVVEQVKSNQVALHRMRLSGAGKKPLWPKLEASIRQWLIAERQAGRRVTAGAFWKEVHRIRDTLPEMKTAKLGFDWRQGLKRHLRRRLSAPARSAVLGVPVVIAKVSNMLTWHRAACHFCKPIQANSEASAQAIVSARHTC